MPRVSIGLDGEMLKWEDAGQKVEGIFHGVQSSGEYMGNMMYIAKIKNQSEEITVACPTILRNKLEICPIGRMVWIEYVGKEVSKKGVAYKNFRVEADLPEDYAPPAQEDFSGPQEDDDDVPF